MKFTWSWLKDHLETDADMATVIDRLSMLGLEVESVENKGESLAPFTIARIFGPQSTLRRISFRFVRLIQAVKSSKLSVVRQMPVAASWVFLRPLAPMSGIDLTLTG